MTAQKPTDLMRAQEVVRALSVTSKTLRAWHAKGTLRAVALPSGLLRWRRADVEAILAPGSAVPSALPAGKA